jgi:hypothetical protein
MYIGPASVIIDEMLRRPGSPKRTYTTESAMSNENFSAELEAKLGHLQQLRERNRALQREVAAIERSVFMRVGKLVRRLRKR